MFINKLNQLYKPKRILYYMDASNEDIQAFYKGVVPPVIEKYSNAFGNYDYPGVFFVHGLQKEVIGIEFRGGDSRIEYPADLKSLELDSSFFYSVEIDDDVEIDFPFIKNLFSEISKEDNAHRPYSDLCIEENPKVFFTAIKKSEFCMNGSFMTIGQFMLCTIVLITLKKKFYTNLHLQIQ